MKKFYSCKYLCDEGEVSVFASNRDIIMSIVDAIYDNTPYDVLVECAEVYLTENEYKNAHKTVNNELFFDKMEV